MSRSVPPTVDQFEISIIGPGRGECVLIHIGDNEWCVVDSCTSRGQSDSVAIEYLDSFRNGAVDRIRLVLATHWHDDHIRGIASLLRRVPTAPFFCSAALRTREFLTLIDSASVGVPGQSGIDEFATVLELLRATQLASGRLATPKYAIATRPLLQLSSAARRFGVSVMALSPSDTTMTLAHAEIASLIPKPGDRQRRIPVISANHTSVAVWVEVGELRALLGGDLLHGGQAGEGWLAVLADHSHERRARLFKVPHHGSRNADCPEVWERMLEKNPIAALTPFTSGVPLPKQSDLRRLGRRTDHVYCTSKGAGKEPSRHSVVEKTMRERLVERHVIEGQPGHVRARWSLADPSTEPIVELFHGTYKFAARG